MYNCVFLSSNTLKYLFFIVALVICKVLSTDHCSRRLSRIARRNLEKNFFPKFQSYGFKVPDECVWNPRWDLLLKQEQNKEEDEIGRLVCNFCGKAFVSEYHIDLHMTNRHSQHLLQANDAICLADYCDILRCDIISGDKKTGYWDEALCNEERLQPLRDSCESHVKSCVPSHIVGDQNLEFTSQLIVSVCSALTCDKFYDSELEEESIYSSSVYVILIVMLVMALVLYYTVAIIHFFTDDSFIKDEAEYPDSFPQRHYVAPIGSEMRNRYTSVRR